MTTLDGILPVHSLGQPSLLRLVYSSIMESIHQLIEYDDVY